MLKVDYEQIYQNGGPPCFAVTDDDPTRYCCRAERWEGHGSDHSFISFDALVTTAVGAAVRAERERLADELYKIKFSTLSASGFGRAVADYIADLRREGEGK